MTKKKTYYIYMLRCEDDSIYTGITVDVRRRMNEHFSQDEKCAKYTMSHRAKKLEAVFSCPERSQAYRLEYHIKRLKKAQKEQLIKGETLDKLLGGKMQVDVYERKELAMETIIFATGNEGKLKEIREILKDLPYQVISLKEAGVDVEIVEDGTTFEENAIKKVTTIMNATGKMVMADDSGLEVDYMDKQPGVYSARFLGEDTSYDVKNQYIIDQLKDAKGSERSARFVCSIAFGVPGKGVITTTGTMEGEIAYEIKGANGFGYDPVFYLPEFGKTSAEISPAEKNEISHRGKALRAMKERIQSEDFNG